MNVYVLKVLIHFRTPEFTFAAERFVKDGYFVARVPQMIIVENHCCMYSSKILPTHVFGNSPYAALSKMLLTNR
jgi:hypothetical protein